MNRKKKEKTELKYGSDFNWEERETIIKDYLNSGESKQSIWEKYTGRRDEHGQIIKWMRHLGYTNEPIVSRRRRSFISMSKKNELPEGEETFENLQLKKRITELEKELKEAQLKAIAFSTMVDIAEQEFKIPIRKKYNTKPSKK